MAGDRREDDLAHEQTAPAASAPAAHERTQTAVPSSTQPTGPSAAPAALTSLGRYRIEGELGTGGMGVVYAAFDPDLERRVALKVLRSQQGDEAHKQRLLREARAMARLTHPNVVTVHEVQTADGRDYVAMELVEGESLADWLRRERRSEDDILAAFVAAGRGLAAAHAAGMVHRDFKPHNVLRSKAGRIAVTDFGLAREAAVDGHAVTGVGSPPAPGVAVGASTPSTPLAGLTMTGSVLGTPAYMAPEQWVGGAVTAATDQFAFCVALWEALAGERPFRGDTLDMLRRAVEIGPASLDDSKLPPRLRPVIRRGLDPVVSKRWPSMDALLAELAPASPANRRSATVLAVGAVLVVAGGVAVYVATRPAAPADPVTTGALGCPPAAAAPAVAIANRPLESAALQRDLAAWTAVRAKVCELAPASRDPQLICLDRTLERLAAVAQAIGKLDAGALQLDAKRWLIDPAVCATTTPRLVPITPELATALAASIRAEASYAPLEPAAIAGLLDEVRGDACAATLAHLLAVRVPSGSREQTLADAEQEAARCLDERIRADAALVQAVASIERTTFGIPKTGKLKVAAAAVERIPQPDLQGGIEALWLQHAARAEDLDEAIRRGELAIQKFEARGRIEPQLDLALALETLRELRGGPGDGARERDAELARWRQRAVAELGEAHPSTRALDRRIALQRFRDGDAVAAQQLLEPLREVRPLERVRRLRARVIDVAGRPVQGAHVFAGASLSGAGTTAAFPFNEPSVAMRSAVTNVDGEIAFDVPAEGLVIAQLGDRRSRPTLIADSVALTLEPTSRLEGKVDLQGADPTRVIVAIADLRIPSTTRYEVLAPVRPDGSFVAEGVPRTRVKLYASLQKAASRTLSSRELQVSTPIVEGVALALENHHTRSVQVIVRSTVSNPSTSAQVWVQPGTARSTTLDKFKLDAAAAIRFAKVPDAKDARLVTLKAGDLLARLEAPTGAATACALSLPAETDEPDLDRKIRDNLDKLEVRCVPFSATDEAVVIEVPPWPRLE